MDKTTEISGQLLQSLELIDIVNKLRTKYAMKLYEYLQILEGTKYIDITHKHTLKLFRS